MSLPQSVQAKERWAMCEALAAKLGISPRHVHDRLYSKLKSMPDAMEAVLAGHEDTVSMVKEWPEYSDPPVSGWTPSGEGPPPARDVGPAPADAPAANGKYKLDRLKLALWFIDKMGGPEKARKAIELAVQVCEEME